MTIQDWGAVGDLIGAAAVVASLVYLAVQIRQNTQQIERSVEATKREALERNIESSNRIRELLILNPEVTDLFLKGLTAHEELAGSEKFRFAMLMSNTFSAFQGAYMRTLTTGSDPLEFRGTARLIDSILDNPGARAWLERNEPDWRPEFQRFIEERLEAINRRNSQETS